MRIWHCHIHDCDYGYPEIIPENTACECPLCLQEERRRLFSEIDKVKNQRNCLLEVIGLKKAVGENP